MTHFHKFSKLGKNSTRRGMEGEEGKRKRGEREREREEKHSKNSPSKAPGPGVYPEVGGDHDGDTTIEQE